MSIGWRDHATQRDPGPISEQRAFGALFAAVYGRLPSRLATARGFDDAPIDRDVFQVQPDNLVVGFQTDLFQLCEEPDVDPLIASVADRGG